MGNWFGKSKRLKSALPPEGTTEIKVTKKVDGILDEYSSELRRWEESQQTQNNKALKQMKEDFISRPDYFVSNMLLLGVQFYKNFDKERNEISKLVRDKELEYNDHLASYRRRIQFLGSHEVIAASHVLYHPKGKEYYELPTYKQYYVIQDNIQLYPEEEFEHLQCKEYSDVDGPSYRFCVEASKRHLGYVRLRCADIVEGLSLTNTYENIYKPLASVADDELDPMIDPRPRRASVDLTTSEAPDENYLTKRRPSGLLPAGYPTISSNSQRSNLPNGVAKSVLNNTLANSSKKSSKKIKIPNVNDQSFDTLKKLLDRCNESDESSEDSFDEKERDSKLPVIDDVQEGSSLSSKGSDANKETIELNSRIRKDCFIDRKIKINKVNDAYNIHKEKNAQLRTYLSSERYRMTFEDSFEDFLKAVKKSELSNATLVEEPSVVIRDLYKETLLINSEYIPAFSYFQWPDCAGEWVTRERRSRSDPDTRMVYRWPKSRHIEEIINKHGCTIVPRGYYNPRNPNRVMLIEWQIHFVRAEQLLLRSLGHQQIKLLLLVQMLFRDHVDKDESRVLRPYHFRYILFWLCEHNYRDWQDDRLAVKVKAYLKTLYNSLAQGNLPHYFIKQVNLLDNIRDGQLRKVQEAVRRINENLPMYLMHTMSRMRTDSDFYQRLNVKRVYKLVSVKKFGVGDLNPALMQATQEEEEEDMFDDDDEEKETEEDIELKRLLHAERNRRNSMFVTGNEEKKQPTKANKKGIDLTIKIKKLNDLRAEKLLTRFAIHFLEIAKSSNAYGDHPQAARYLQYSRNMLDILRDEDIKCPVPTGSDVEEIESEIDGEWDVMRQGMNYMLNNTHKLTDTMELKMAHPPPTPNWELKKTTEPVQGKTTKKKTPRQIELENMKPEKYTKVPKKEKISKNMSKSLTDLTDPPVLRSMMKKPINDEETVIVFKVASDDENESTDL